MQKLVNRAMTHLDFMRGVAAFAVVVGHVRDLFFIDFDMVARPSRLTQVFYLLSGLGHQAVVVFFVLSGFFVGLSVLGSRQRWSWGQYLLRRLTRLYVVLLPALVLTALLDRVGMAIVGSDGVYAGHFDAPHFSLEDVRSTGGLKTFFGNLFFLQSIFVRPFGSNGPLWSLSLEFWAYILFPLGVQALTRGRPLILRTAYAGIATIILYVGGARLAFYFCLWLLGAAVAAMAPKLRLAAQRLRHAAVGGSLAVFFAALFLARIRSFGPQDANDSVLALATALLLSSLLSAGAESAPATPRPGGYARLAHLVAGYSYTLYLVHFPMVLFIRAIFPSARRWTPDLGHVAVGISVAIAVAWLFAYPLALITEANTERVRTWLSKAFKVGLAAAPPAAER